MLDHCRIVPAGAAPPAPTEEPVLSVRHLAKAYGSRQVLRDVSLEVRRGEFVVILGPSGTGKSTLFRCITRLTEPDRGQILFEGADVQEASGSELEAVRRRVGFVFQHFNLVRRLDAVDNVLAARLGHTPLWRAMLRRFPRADRQLALSCLDSVGMLAHAYQRVDALSGGQQQRVAIARALAQESHLIIADEPIASLDPETARGVLGILRAVAKEQGIPVLCSLHQVELALHVADRIVGFRDGAVTVECPAAGFSEEHHEKVYGRRAEAGAPRRAFPAVGAEAS